MRETYRNWIGLLLVLALLPALTACGGGAGEEQLSGTVYVPEFLDFPLEELGVQHITTGCCDGVYVYILADVMAAAGQTDPLTGEVYSSYETYSTIFRLPLDGGEATRLENFTLAGQSGEAAYDRESYSYVESISVDSEGGLWVAETTETAIYGVPEDFDPETDYMWNYELVEHRSDRIRRRLDETGAETARVDAAGMQEALGLNGQNGYIGSTVMDREGNFYVFAEVDTDGGTETKVTVLDGSMERIFALDTNGSWGDLVLLGDGSVGMSLHVYDRLTGEGGQCLRIIDREKESWGEEYPMPVNAGGIYPGSGKYLFYYDNGDSLYGYDAEKKAGERLLTWSSADINRSDLSFFTFLADGRVAAMTTTWGPDGMETEVVLLTETDASVLADRTVLTYATMYLGYDMRQRIIDFNKSQTDCRIEIRDYAEFNTAEDYDAGLTKLSTEIVAGQVPDILDTNGLPIRQYGSRGLLEDLWPYIDADEELGGRDGLMIRVLEAAGQDGALYQIFGSFTIRTAVGGAEVVGREMSWSLAQLCAALETMPDGCAIFGEGDTKESMLSGVLAMQMDNFVDWSTGECSFDGEEFISLLEFCDSFPLRYDRGARDPYEYDDEPTRISEGRQLLSMETVYDFQYLQLQEHIFGGAVTYVGYPREDGGVGSSFMPDSGLAMSTTCADKEAAWAFMRQVVLPRSTPEEENFYFNGWGFPVNRQDFDRMAQQYMTPVYQLDEMGEPMLDENGQPIELSQGGMGWGNGQMVELYATTQAQYDQIMALYESIDSLYSYDESIYSIVRGVALRYFNGDLTSRQAAHQIQSRVKIYVNENL